MTRRGPHFGVPISNYLGWYSLRRDDSDFQGVLDATLKRGEIRPFGMSSGFRRARYWDRCFSGYCESSASRCGFRIHETDRLGEFFIYLAVA